MPEDSATLAIMRENSPMATIPRPAPMAFLTPKPVMNVENEHENILAPTNTAVMMSTGMTNIPTSENRLMSTSMPTVMKKIAPKRSLTGSTLRTTSPMNLDSEMITPMTNAPMASERPMYLATYAIEKQRPSTVRMSSSPDRWRPT